ncbi:MULTISPECIES: hypothetical protein [Sinorhizobium]|nr:hypothetical protein U8C39_22275 [Sinorhizobium meliloti]WQP21727.1 hypothetical protein U8C33_22400 [Sinorhizobium meliloti]WQP35143.1 hypothetical protein U8C45_22235 [Sinorhizobium meliloti]
MNVSPDWGLEIVVNEVERSAWTENLRAPFEPFADLLYSQNGPIVIRSVEFVGLTTAEDVYFTGKDLLLRLNASMETIAGLQPAIIGAVVDFRGPHPKRTNIIEAKGIESKPFFGRATITQVDLQGRRIEAPASASPAQEQMQASLFDPAIGAAIKFLSGEPSWAEIYKAIEALDKTGLASSAISENKKSLMRRTANSEERHWKKDLGFTPMQLAEARVLMKRWLRMAVKELVKERSTSAQKPPHRPPVL